MADEHTPLTSLCAICHVNPLKYTCPRCGIHTCSLPCVKLHKRRAQCSGVRNPAEYRKRSELVMEASVDKDFNFITSLERNLQRADEDVVEKKIDLRPANTFDFKGGAGLERAAEARGVKLIRAPNGLSRRQENKSKVLGKEARIMWTVEWLGRNQQRRVQNFDEEKTIGEAYLICHPKRALGKRKRGQDGPAGEQPCHQAEESAPEHCEKRQDLERGESHIKEAHQLTLQQEKLLGSLAMSSFPGEAEQEKPVGLSASTREPAPDEDKKPPLENTSGIPDHVHFYLHRPQTSSKIKCLIPISATDAIRDTLKGKKIVEFPTIYVRHEAPEELTEPFILESTYLEQHGEDVMVPAQPVLSSDTVLPTNSPSIGTVDSQKVFEVLKQDLVSV